MKKQEEEKLTEEFKKSIKALEEAKKKLEEEFLKKVIYNKIKIGAIVEDGFGVIIKVKKIQLSYNNIAEIDPLLVGVILNKKTLEPKKKNPKHGFYLSKVEKLHEEVIKLKDQLKVS